VVLLANRTQCDEFHQQTQKGSAHSANNERDDDAAGPGQHEESEIRARHQHGAMRHVDDAQHAENERESDCHERVAAADNQAVDDLLQKDGHDDADSMSQFRSG
jgi:hypothetical protein